MLTYITRRILIGLITLILITFIVYALIRHMPGNPMTVAMSESDPSRMPSAADREMMAEAYGLNDHWTIGYAKWLGGLFVGDLGDSFHEKEPALIVIGRRIWPTMLLSITSLGLTYLLAVPIGLYAIVRRNMPDERMVSTVLYMLYSLPSFVAGLLLLYIFYQRLAGTPFAMPIGMTSPDYDQMSLTDQLRDVAWHMVLPVVCYTYGSLAYLSRFVKSNMEEVIRQDYIRTARAKGVAPMTIIVSHAFRNTLIPFVTMIGLMLPALLGGSVILEQIFSWPGMGKLFFTSIAQRDYPVMMGLTLMFSVLTLLGQLLADILYTVVDPRISYK